MNTYEPALEHIRNSIATAEVLKLTACAVLVCDLKTLLEMAERARSGQDTSPHDKQQ
jgi:hypothetical protein